MHVEVVSRIADRADFSLRAVRWIAGIRDIIFPEFDETQHHGIVPFAAPSPPSGYWVLGRPDSIQGTLFFQSRPNGGLGRGAKYSRSSWDGFARRAGSGAMPFGMTLLLTSVIGQGEGQLLGSSVQIRVHRDEDAPDWIRFEANLPADIIDWEKSRGLQEELIAFVRNWITNFDVSYGHVTDDADSLGTALERAIKRYSWSTIPRCREELRGYSWITIIAKELADSLGGVDKLKDSGSFYDVAEGSGGSIFLRATEMISEYGSNEIRKVFRVLAPVLLAGMVGGGEDGDQPGRLVQGVDAANFGDSHD